MFLVLMFFNVNVFFNVFNVNVNVTVTNVHQQRTTRPFADIQENQNMMMVGGSLLGLFYFDGIVLLILKSWDVCEICLTDHWRNGPGNVASRRKRWTRRGRQTVATINQRKHRKSAKLAWHHNFCQSWRLSRMHILRSVLSSNKYSVVDIFEITNTQMICLKWSAVLSKLFERRN